MKQSGKKKWEERGSMEVRCDDLYIDKQEVFLLGGWLNDDDDDEEAGKVLSVRVC